MAPSYRKTQSIARKYDATADTHYDVRYSEGQFEKYRSLLDAVAGTLPPVPGTTIVDSGCGSGLLLPFLSQNGVIRGKCFVGLDISGGMLARAMIKAGHRPGTCFIRATVDLLPLRDGVASDVFSVSTFQNLDTKQQGQYFKETRRVMQGYDATFFFGFLDKPPLSDDVDKILQDLKHFFKNVVVIEKNPRIEDRLFVCKDP
nr:class I SAM-dependent methyltransferase [Candidatus Sigynarchaeota archaeon]